MLAPDKKTALLWGWVLWTREGQVDPRTIQGNFCSGVGTSSHVTPLAERVSPALPHCPSTYLSKENKSCSRSAEKPQASILPTLQKGSQGSRSHCDLSELQACMQNGWKKPRRARVHIYLYALLLIWVSKCHLTAGVCWKSSPCSLFHGIPIPRSDTYFL